ncbi:hypothetical protein [Streptomyces sp. MI02-7b]|uniref:hypothetical protein n=1 Tax=Streptomyces sp. MI02-7b TaxID=462941 RepID=UPI0029ACF8E7|nr:hypothetical protein [Streptomyces sp. MI02-7b]MDX3072924.1 hypothetical protein [Streptomyces sp. MI02-7b]
MIEDARGFAPADRRPERQRSTRTRFEHAQGWVTALAGILALALSVSNFVELRRQPDVDVSLPHLVRIAQGKEVWLYLQPTVSSRVRAGQSAVITDVHLDVLPLGRGPGAARPDFFWDETGTLRYDPETHAADYVRTADPGPLLVTQERPQQPLMLFDAIGWNFHEGRYLGRLTLHRAGAEKPITESFCLVVSKRAATTLEEAGQYTYHEFRNDVPGAGTDRNGCYVLPAG